MSTARPSSLAVFPAPSEASFPHSSVLLTFNLVSASLPMVLSVGALAIVIPLTMCPTHPAGFRLPMTQGVVGAVLFSCNTIIGVKL